MKVIQINAWYGVWSTGKIVKNIQTGLQEEGVECLVLYGRGKKEAKNNAFKFASTLEPKINSLLFIIVSKSLGFFILLSF